MNGKQARRARAYASNEAKRRGLWKQGEDSVYAKWWKKLLAWLSPKYKKRNADLIGLWYKRTLKHWSRDVYNAMHDPDFEAMRRARKKIAKERAKKRQAKATAMLERPA